MTSAICCLCAQPDGIVCAGVCRRSYCPMCLIEAKIRKAEPVFNEERINMNKRLLECLGSNYHFTCTACQRGTSVCSICLEHKVNDQGPLLVCCVPGCQTVFHQQCYKKAGLPTQDIFGLSFSCPRHVCLHCKKGKSGLPVSVCIRCNSMIHLACRKAFSREMRPLFFGSREADCACLCNKCYILILSTSTRPTESYEPELYLRMYVRRREDISLRALSTLFDTQFVDRLCHLHKQLQANNSPKEKVIRAEKSKGVSSNPSQSKLDHQAPKEPQLKQLTSKKSVIQPPEKQDLNAASELMPAQHSVLEVEASSLSTSVIITTPKTNVSFTKAMQPEIIRCQTIMIRQKSRLCSNSST
ncbi:hypothetical protein GL50803_0020594 [Giardia duodenalis]|uniref:Uncharacterized protein n=1 Tax=Giardia intestinalis (strain ATCC 50803 / WB clone C6) TaxID=184922 RepID=D3KHU4_GIAIC|nr:hypothetical protein GL50803_0020594 [Giardia intestinalis]KAE8304409.1 hypothetical protein GL50803_0020594 [Giardia intestinalis]